MAVKRKKIKK